MKTKYLLAGLICCLISSVVNAQTYVPHKWGAVAMGGGGFVSAIITCPTEKNLIYCRTDVGGAYRWNEATKSWIPLNNMTSEANVGLLGIEALAIDPQLPNRLYMLAGTDYFSGGKTAILRSDDYGNSFSTIEVTDLFKAHGNGMGRQNGERLVVDPQNSNILFCGSRKNGLFKSTDAGITWSRVSSLNITTTNNGNGICAVVFDKSSGLVGNATKTIYVGVSRMGQENLYVSNDAGETWTAVAGQPTTYMPQRLVMSSDGNLYIPYANGAGPGGNTAEPMGVGALWKYNTKLKNWTNISPTGITKSFGAVSVDASNPKKLIATTVSTWWKQPWGDGDFIFISEDGGTTWTDMYKTKNVTMDANGIGWITNHAIHWSGSIEIDPFNPNRFFVTSGNGLFGSENMNARPLTVKFMAQGIEETVPFDIYNTAGSKLITVIGDYEGFVHDDVKTFPLSNHKPGLGSTYGLATAPAARNIAVRASKGMYYTDNSGTSWTKINDPVTPKGGEVCLTADGGSILWCVDDGTTTYYTKNKGTNWTACAGINFACAPAADYVNANKVYAYNATDGYVYVSVDAGASFTKAGMAATGGSRTLRTVPGIDGNVWVAAGVKGLWKSTNSGTSFVAVANVNQCDAVGFGKAAPNQTHPVAYIWGRANGGVTGLYRSIDGGANWQRINDEQHQFGGPGNGGMVKGDVEIYGRVYMSSVGLGIIYGDVISEIACEYPDLGNDKYICEAYTVTLDTKISQAGYSFAWSKGTTTLAGTNSTITVPETGIYRVDVKKSGCPDVFDYVQVKTKLFPATTDTVCPNEAASISVSGSGTYAWYDAQTNGTLVGNGNTFAVSPTASKTYYVQDNKKTLYSLGLPSMVTQNWTLGGGFADNQNRIRISVSSPLLVKSIAMNVAGAGKGVIRITNDAGTVLTSGSVASMPTGLQAIPINYQLSAGTYYIDAVGTTASISFQSSSAGAKWSIPDYLTLTQLSGWGAYGIFFDIQFEVSNTCVRTPVDVVVLNPQIPTITTSKTTTAICQGDSVTLTASTGSSYKWMNGTTAAGTTQAITAKILGSYTVEVTNTLGCKANSAPTVITINNPEAITFNYQVNAGTWTKSVIASLCPNDKLQFAAWPVSGSTWKWTGPNGFTANTRNPLISVTDNAIGTYTATQTDANGCSSTAQFTLNKGTCLITQNIALQQGWNLISTNVRTSDSTIATLFNGLDVQEIKTMNRFWRKSQNDVFNGLKTITPTEGYLVNMNVAGTLIITGAPIQTQFIASPQQTSWNLIGCPYQTATLFSQDFNASNCSAIKNFEGFWIPNGGTSNSIQSISPGNGYFLKK